MSTVAESANTINFDATAWPTAVRRVSELAHARLPDALHGRVERATALVLSGGVWLEDDGTTCQVRASDGTWRHVNGHCPCEDALYRAQEGWCKHRLGKAIALRARELLSEGLPPVADDLTLSDNAAVPATSPVPLQYIVQIQGRPFVKFAGLAFSVFRRNFGR